MARRLRLAANRLSPGVWVWSRRQTHTLSHTHTPSAEPVKRDGLTVCVCACCPLCSGPVSVALRPRLFFLGIVKEFPFVYFVPIIAKREKNEGINHLGNTGRCTRSERTRGKRVATWNAVLADLQSRCVASSLLTDQKPLGQNYVDSQTLRAYLSRNHVSSEKAFQWIRESGCRCPLPVSMGEAGC